MSESAASAYIDTTIGLLEEVRAQLPSIGRAADLVAAGLSASRPVNIFGTGHSHMIAEEAYYRAGGLVQVRPILVTGLMLHESVRISTHLERLPGLAAALLQEYPLDEDDVLIIVSNSGANAVAVELAQEASRRGTALIAITSLHHANSAHARSVGKRIHEFADVVIDNAGRAGDAAVTIPGLANPVGPTSTITGAAILNSIVVGAAERLTRAGHPPAVYTSANLAAGDANNSEYLAQGAP